MKGRTAIIGIGGKLWMQLDKLISEELNKSLQAKEFLCDLQTVIGMPSKLGQCHP